MSDKELLNEKLRSKITLPIGDVLSDSFELFGKAAGKYIGFTILLFVVIGVTVGVTAIVPFLGIPLIVFLGLVASPALVVGVGRFTKKLKEGQNPEFSDFLSGFKHNLGQLVLQGFIISLISSAITFGLSTDLYLSYFDIAMSYDGDLQDLAAQFQEAGELYGETTVLSFLGGVFSFYISLGLSLTPYIVSFYKVNAFTAMDISFRTINKVVFQAAVIQIVLTVIAVMGVIIVLIGLFATLPILFIGTYLIFRYAIGEKPTGEQDEWSVNEHLVD